MIRIAIVGFGTVGQGVAELLLKKKEEIEKRIGKFKVVAVADSKSSVVGEVDLKAALEEKRKKGRLSGDKSAVEIVEKAEYDVLFECTPTNVETGEPGLTHIKLALKNGRNVVTSNKGPLVVAYKELCRLAEKNSCKLGFEATVGGAMPLIKLVKNDLAGSGILRIRGILNGTCNYILSRMEVERMPYEQILAEAIELGIAEADPSYDVRGIDAAAKLVIIANALMDMDVKFEDVEIEGIEDITPEAFEVAVKKGHTIRLIADAGSELKVSPRLVPLNHPLNIYGTLNAAEIVTETAGRVFVIGRGAGKLETASAMISDLIDMYDRGNLRC